MFFVFTLLRLLDWRADHAEWLRLTALQPVDPMQFDPMMVTNLPEPAQRFFKYAIAPGTPLLPVAEIDMGGQFSLATKASPNYRRMEARQILAAPHGFVWRMRLPGWIPVSGSDAGSDSKSWTRFRILGIVPVAHMGGNADHLRSAYGRYIAEALFWTPAALMPGPNVTWQAVDKNTARALIGAFIVGVILRKRPIQSSTLVGLTASVGTLMGIGIIQLGLCCTVIYCGFKC